jgi:hypothetical protein
MSCSFFSSAPTNGMVGATSDPDAARLVTPEIASLVELAGVSVPKDGKSRVTLLNAMRKAAERRIVGVSNCGRVI